jgi:hypothetical protein
MNEHVSLVPRKTAETAAGHLQSFGPYFRGVNRTTDRVVWFMSHGDRAISSPEACSGDEAEDGVLHVHQYGGFDDTQVWIAVKGKWEIVLEGYPHPNNSGYMFSMQEKNKPTWVKKIYSLDKHGQQGM